MPADVTYWDAEINLPFDPSFKRAPAFRAMLRERADQDWHRYATYPDDDGRLSRNRARSYAHVINRGLRGWLPAGKWQAVVHVDHDSGTVELWVKLLARKRPA